jgi:hypothetical protein
VDRVFLDANAWEREASEPSQTAAQAALPSNAAVPRMLSGLITVDSV